MMIDREEGTDRPTQTAGPALEVRHVAGGEVLEATRCTRRVCHGVTRPHRVRARRGCRTTTTTLRMADEWIVATTRSGNVCRHESLGDEKQTRKEVDSVSLRRKTESVASEEDARPWRHKPSPAAPAKSMRTGGSLVPLEVGRSGPAPGEVVRGVIDESGPMSQSDDRGRLPIMWAITVSPVGEGAGRS